MDVVIEFFGPAEIVEILTLFHECSFRRSCVIEFETVVFLTDPRLQLRINIGIRPVNVFHNKFIILYSTERIVAG